MYKNKVKKAVTCLGLALLLAGGGVTLVSASSTLTEIKARGIGDDSPSGAVAYTVGYNPRFEGEVRAGIRPKKTSKYFYGYGSGRGTFTASVSYSARKEDCDHVHEITK